MSVFDTVAEKYEALPNILAKAYAMLVIKTVDEYAKQFKESVEQQTPFISGDLRNSIKLTQIYKNGQYGYRISFDGYNQWNQPFQVIANTLNKGERKTDDGRSISLPSHIGFISKNLEILRQINPTLAQNMIIGGWSVDDQKVVLNDGTIFTKQDLEDYSNILNNATGG